MATGLTVSGTSNLSNGSKILVSGARMANEPAAPDPDLWTNTRIPQGHFRYDKSTYARLGQATALTEGVDLSQVEQLVTSTLQITPTEHGIITALSKVLIRRQGDSDVINAAGMMIGRSLRRRFANDIIALYDGFSKSSPGASLTLDITHFRGVNAFIMTDNDSAFGPGEPPFNAALHIEQISDIILDITDTTPRGTTTGVTGDLLQRWWRTRDRLYGVEVFHSGLISRDNAGDSKGAIGSMEALYSVMANNADTTEEEDPSLRATEYGIFQEWGESEHIDPWGVEIYSDSNSTL
jgi:hypothetical protein